MGTRALKFTSATGLRSCLVWLLCLCAWRAPVPVVHCHLESAESLSAEAVDSGTAGKFLKHLQLFHAGSMDASLADWHLHFVLPSPMPGSDCPSDADLPEQPLNVPVHSAISMVDLAADDAAQGKASVTDVYAPSPAAHWSDAPRLIPLAPPRIRPKRLSPLIALCVSRC